MPFSNLDFEKLALCL